MSLSNLNSYRNNPYDGLTKESTDEERIDALFEVLLTSSYPEYLSVQSLKLPLNGESDFNSQVIETGFVDDISGDTGQIKYRLKTNAFKPLKKYGSYSAYLNAKIEEQKTKDAANEEKGNLEIQKLRSDNLKLTQELVDYPKVKKQRDIAMVVAILTLCLLFVKLLLGK